MKPNSHQYRGLRVPHISAALAAVTLPALPAFTQEVIETVTPAIQFEVEAERSVPLPEGGRLVLQRVAQPALPPAAPEVRPPLLSPEERAAHLAARRAAAPPPRQTCLLWFYVMVHEDGLSYIEWWPEGGGGPYAAWSQADFRYMSMIPDFEVENTETRYLIFPSVFLRPRPGAQPAERPAIAADGPGYVLVKGDPDNARAIAPFAALHQIYREEYAMLKADYELREAARDAAAALPLPPPQDVVLRFLPATGAAPTADATSNANLSPATR